jgi:hypothetical protein
MKEHSAGATGRPKTDRFQTQAHRQVFDNKEIFFVTPLFEGGPDDSITRVFDSHGEESI